ncbi:DUF3613 domain-containing protein [Paraburkholderia lacunae]|uniref:DUF3613 domain-containing protein n=2 Tax=Paraburkholderia lacunae TaxID=2211104 RepID=A0A370NE85_9BURK|nr:DUF3613 domain-containing protein [Paraburkholderia lacunae]
MMGVATAAFAQTDEPAQPAQPPMRASEVGHATRAWLELQSSNTQAAPALPMLGAEAGLAYRRYMESFKSRIPELYGSALNNGGGGGNGGGIGGGNGGSGGTSGGLGGGGGGGGY